MNNPSIKGCLSRAIIAVSSCLAVSAHAASNTYTINDDQEIAFNSGYDIARVEFTLFDSETLQIDITPYGVPGDADGDGDPDASSNPAILDSPGVSGLERILMGMVCDYQVGDPCQPNLLLTYANNALTATTTSGNPIPEGSITFAIIDAVPDPDNKPDTYRLTINNLSTVKQQVLGFIPTSVTFGAFSFSAHFGDSQPDDFAPDRNPSTGAVVCELVELAPPVTEAPGTGTIGYWKNHPSEWPVGCDLTLPGSDSNADVFAMNILDAPVKGDKTVILAKQVIGAMLNVCAGNATACTVEGISYDINQTIDSSITWLNTYGPVFSKQKNWNGGDIHQEILDDYNNGKLCAPHR